MAHRPIDMTTSIYLALALIEEVKAMLAKMVAAKDEKKDPPTDVLSSLPPSDGQHLPPPYVPPLKRVVFKRMCCIILRERARAAWFIAQGPSLSSG
jgi:hypothetical protein